MARGIQSIVLGFRLLQVIAEAGVPLSLKAIAALSGMSPSKARMYLISHIETGMVAQSPESALYGLGPYALRLGTRALQRIELIGVATDAMNALQHHTRSTVLLGAWNQHGVTIVSRSSGGVPLPELFDVGGAVPLAGSAAGLIFLAFGQPDLTWGRLQAELDAAKLSKTERKKRLQTLEELAAGVRKRRIAETASGYASVAAPVFDGARQLRYAMTLVSSDVPDRKRRVELGRLTLEAADRISHYAGADMGLTGG